MKITPQEEEWLKENLEKIDFLQHLNSLQVLFLIDEITAQNIPGGETVIRQGHIGDTFFLIFNGKVSVWIEKKEKRAKIAELKSGDYFGEISLLTGKPATATVIANKQTRVFFLNSQLFLELVRENPILSTHISDVMQKRLKERKAISDAMDHKQLAEISQEIHRFLSGGETTSGGES